MDAIVGMTFPLTRTGEDSDKALARSMLEDNIMAAVFTGSSLHASCRWICLLSSSGHHYVSTQC